MVRTLFLNCLYLPRPIGPVSVCVCVCVFFFAWLLCYVKSDRSKCFHLSLLLVLFLNLVARYLHVLTTEHSHCHEPLIPFKQLNDAIAVKSRDYKDNTRL